MDLRRLVLQSSLARRLREPTGQVSRTDGLGRWITLLASLDTVQTIVEIGTWKGNGTTRCIADGIAHRSAEDVNALCLEADRDMARIASRRWDRDPRIEVIWGCLVAAADLDLVDLTGAEVEWAEADERRIREAPHVLNLMPSRIDLLVLDGGEFTTHAEFHLLRSRVAQWLVLDDVRTRKCRAIADEITGGSGLGFLPVWQSDERNGVLVARRADTDARI